MSSLKMATQKKWDKNLLTKRRRKEKKGPIKA